MNLVNGAIMLARIVVIVFCLASGSVAGAQNKTAINRGTVNIGLANSNGIILLTDSMQSHREQDGWHYVQPVQKLFQLDAKTVCSIAGFAGETGWITPELNTDVAGIITDFRTELSQKPVPELEAKLEAIGFVVGFYIDLIANRNEVRAGAVIPSNVYMFEVIVAGYDLDGKPKLEKLVLNSTVAQTADGHRLWSHTTSLEVAPLGRVLVSLLGGKEDFSRQVLDSPEKFGDNAAIRRYAESKMRDRGASLSRDDMAALAREMAAQAARQTPFVGGTDQIAVLSGGKITSFEQPPFPSRVASPMKFALLIGVKVEGGLMMVSGPGTHLLWIRSKFIGVRNPRLRLDGQFFYGCEIRDSMVEYGGGLTDLGPTNSVINSMLLPEFPSISTDEWTRIWKMFKWSPEPPDGPSLHPSISPL